MEKRKGKQERNSTTFKGILWENCKIYQKNEGGIPNVRQKNIKSKINEQRV